MNDPNPIFGQPDGNRTRFRPLRALVILLATLLLIAAGGFLQFLTLIPEQAPRSLKAAPMDVDAIVVLTGGRDRIHTALALLDNGTGARLLISGVNTDTSRDDLAAEFGGTSSRFDCCVDLGFQARTTIGNADETAKWASDKGYASLAVVTSDYHMPRSLLLLAEEMPDATLVPVPVASEGLSGDAGFASVRVARILVSEYAKYIITLFQCRFA